MSRVGATSTAHSVRDGAVALAVFFVALWRRLRGGTPPTTPPAKPPAA